jgi:hypothetical protein
MEAGFPESEKSKSSGMLPTLTPIHEPNWFFALLVGVFPLFFQTG